MHGAMTTIITDNKLLAADGRLPSGKAVYYWVRQVTHTICSEIS